MPSKLIKKYRKNNRRTKSKRGGGGECPKFGNINSTKWGGIGGCGFDVFVKVENSTQRWWVDISDDKQPKITKISLQEGKAEPKVVDSNTSSDPLSLLKYFPDGFYLTKECVDVITSEYLLKNLTNNDLLNTIIGPPPVNPPVNPPAIDPVNPPVNPPPANSPAIYPVNPPASGGSKNMTKRSKNTRKRRKQSKKKKTK